jgi:hypothetical protein
MNNKALLLIAALTLPVLAFTASSCTVNRIEKPAEAPAVAATASADAPSPPKSEPDNEAFRQAAVRACTESAARDGVPEDMSQGYCNCAINGLLQQLSAEQISDIALSGSTQLPPDVEDKLSQNVLDCIDKLVSE